MPKIRQNSPLRKNGNVEEKSTEIIARKEDGVDLQIRDHKKKVASNVLSDPTQSSNALRPARSIAKRNYKQMLDGDEIF